MSRTMTTGRRAKPESTNIPITEAIQDRVSRLAVRKELRKIRREQAQARRDERRYDGGLPAEASALELLRRDRRVKARRDRRRVLISRIGRRIDLTPLLDQRRPDGAPRWTIADPVQVVNADWRWAGNHYVTEGGRDGCRITVGGKTFELPCREVSSRYAPVGFPALPPRVRELATDPKIRRRARWVGVLYEPAEWRQINPDPALVVEWRSEPGVYYALAVWGVDGPRIMEWVD